MLMNRTSKLKIRNESTELKTLYENAQKDIGAIATLLMDWSLVPYSTTTNTGEVLEFSPEDIMSRLRKQYSGQQLADVLYVGECVALMAVNGVSSLYGLFSEGYQSTGNKFPGAFLKSLIRLPESEVQERVKEKVKFDEKNRDASISVDDWMLMCSTVRSAYFNKVKDHGGNLNKEEESKIMEESLTAVKETWDKVSEGYVTKFINTVNRLRGSKQVYQIGNSKDCGYCRSVVEIARREVRGLHERNVVYQQKTKELQDKLAYLKEKAGDVYPVVVKLIADCEKQNVIVSKYGMKQALNIIDSAGEKVNYDKADLNTKLIVNEIEKAGIAKLLHEKSQGMRGPSNKAYDAIEAYKLELKLKTRKKYPYRPQKKSDYSIPFGLTGLMPFRFDGNGLKLTLNNIDVDVYKSHYFNDLMVTKDKQSFVFNFNHRVKKRGKRVVGNQIRGVCKEISLQRVAAKQGNNDVLHYYLNVNYSIEHPDDNQRLRNYFQTADHASSKEDKLAGIADSFVTCSCDLGINPVATCTVAKVTKEGGGPIEALDYGTATILETPYKLDGEVSFSDISKLKGEIYQLKNSIKNFKIAKKNGLDLDQETKEFLEKCPGNFPRRQIEQWMGKLKNKLSKIKGEERRKGHTSLARTVHLLGLVDEWNSLHQSYKRIHLKAGESLLEERKSDKTRVNFRNYANRKLAASILQYALRVNPGVNMIILENLNMRMTKESRFNNITRLFNPQQLLKCIEEAANKVGISVTLASKEGTSQIDPVTGELGFRDKKCEKEKLFVFRDGKLVWIHSDEAASVNILLRGLGHSIVPYKFYLKKSKEDVTTEEEEETQGKRLKRFFSWKFGVSKPKFYVDATGNLTVSAKKLPKRQEYVGWVYYYGGTFHTENQHLATRNFIETKVKNQRANGIKIEQVDVIPANTYTKP